MMRQIKRIFVHCTGGHQYNYTDDSLVNEFRRKGWKYPGYHYVVRPDGSVFKMLSEDKVSNGVSGYNSTAINVAYVGGIDRNTLKPVDNRTEAQKCALITLLQDLRIRYPKAYILGHRDISNDVNGNGVIDQWEYIKACPCFNAEEEYSCLNLGLKKPV